MKKVRKRRERQPERETERGGGDWVKKQEPADMSAGECVFIHFFREPYASVDLHKNLMFGTDGSQRISEDH